MENIEEQIAALSRMTVRELHQRHLELFGEHTKSNHRQFLFRRIAWRIQALAEGGIRSVPNPVGIGAADRAGRH